MLHDDVAGEQDVWLDVVAVCLVYAIDYVPFGTNPPKTRNTSSCQSSSSESLTEMNHPDVPILTIRRYAWTS